MDIYVLNGTLVNDRPLYVGHDKEFGMWFDSESEKPSWMLGYLSDLEEGHAYYGFLQGTDDTSCPTSENTWREWRNEDWHAADKAVVECVTGMNVYECTCDIKYVLLNVLFECVKLEV